MSGKYNFFKRCVRMVVARAFDSWFVRIPDRSVDKSEQLKPFNRLLKWTIHFGSYPRLLLCTRRIKLLLEEKEKRKKNFKPSNLSEVNFTNVFFLHPF